MFKSQEFTCVLIHHRPAFEILIYTLNLTFTPELQPKQYLDKGAKITPRDHTTFATTEFTNSFIHGN